MRLGGFGPSGLGRRLRAVFFAVRGRAVWVTALGTDQIAHSGGTGRRGPVGRNDTATDADRNGRTDLLGSAGHVDQEVESARSHRHAGKAGGTRTVWKSPRRHGRPHRIGSRDLIRLLPSVLILAGLLVEFLLPAHYTGSPFLAAAPLAAAPLFSRRATFAAGLASVAAVIAVHTTHRDATYLESIIEMATVVTVAGFALFINSVLRRGDVRLASARGVAEAVQRAVLPEPGPWIGGLEVAARYEAAQTEASIGGDLYAVQNTPYGVRLIVGDVRGKGLEAVEAVAVLIGAFREAAEQEAALEDVAARLDRALRREGERRDGLDEIEGFATAVLVEVPSVRPAAPRSGSTGAAGAGTTGLGAGAAGAEAEADAATRARARAGTGATEDVPGGRTPAERPLRRVRKGHQRERAGERDLPAAGVCPAGSVRVLNRGHPAPLILYEGGKVCCAEPAVPALPLGMGDLGMWSDQVEEFPFPEGTLLLLFTDGVTEARDPSGVFYEPEERLRGRSFSRPGRLLDALVADVARHTRRRTTDDMALLAIMCPTNPA